MWWLGSYGGGVFVPLKDASAGQRTYGGGRYVLDTVKGADLGGDAHDGRLVLDLNFAYNPSCAYDPRWSCPLAPEGNRVAAPVTAGWLRASAPTARAMARRSDFSTGSAVEERVNVAMPHRQASAA